LETKQELARRRRAIRNVISRQKLIAECLRYRAQDLEQVLKDIDPYTEPDTDPDPEMYEGDDPVKTIKDISRSLSDYAVDILDLIHVAEAAKSLPPMPAKKKVKARVQAAAAE
jgi:hypothetical protein